MPMYFKSSDYMHVSLDHDAYAIKKTLPAKFQVYLAFGCNILSFGIDKSAYKNCDQAVIFIDDYLQLEMLKKHSETNNSVIYDDNFDKQKLITENKHNLYTYRR